MAELYRVKVEQKREISSLRDAASLLDDPMLGFASTSLIHLGRLKKKGLPGLAKLKKAPAGGEFLKAEKNSDVVLSFAKLVAAEPEVGRKAVLGMTKASEKSGEPKDDADGWLQRQLLAAAGGKSPEPLAVVRVAIAQIHPDAGLPDELHGTRLDAFLASLLALDGSASNPVLDTFGGLQGLTRPTVAPKMSEAERDAWLAKLQTIIFQSESGSTRKSGNKSTLEASFTAPSRFVSAASKGASWDSTGWPLLGG